MKIPLISLIIQGIPETIALVTLAFILAKINLEWKKIILLALFLAFISYILRLFPITFGIHTIILMGFLFLFLIYHYQVPLITSLRVSLFTYLTLIIVEFSCLTLIKYAFGISLELYLDNLTLRILIGLPQVFVLAFLAFVASRLTREREIL